MGKDKYGIPDILKDMSCNECGRMPIFEKTITYWGAEVTLNYKNWQVTYKGDSVDHRKPILCPLCIRKNKIEKIKQCISLMNT